MAGNANSGGHNATIGAELPPGHVESWPWMRPHNRKHGAWPRSPWTPDRIRRRLVDVYAARRIPGGVDGATVFDALALAHWRAHLAHRRLREWGLDQEDDPPKVWGRCAAAVQREAFADIDKANRVLNVWPNPRPAAAAGREWDAEDAAPVVVDVEDEADVRYAEELRARLAAERGE